MRVTRTLWILIAVALAPSAVFVLTGGCTAGTAVSDVLDALTAGATTAADKEAQAADAALIPSRPPRPGMDFAGPELTEEQRTALKALEDSLSAGTITQDEFCQQVHDLLGDPPCGPPLPPIDLTEEQQAQAKTIFQQAHDQIVALHATARDQVLGQLTAEQKQKLTELGQPPAPPDGQVQPPAPPCPPPENSACAQPAQVPLPPCPEQGGQPGGPQHGGPPPQDAAGTPPQGGPPAGGPPMGPGHGGPPPVCLSGVTIATLAITDEQVAAIKEIHAALDAATTEARDAAQQAFRALLTDEQLQELDQLPPPPPLGGPRPPR